jgi:hypothetical protein
MKAKLNFYYSKKRKALIVLLIANLIYIVLVIFKNVLKLSTTLDYYELSNSYFGDSTTSSKKVIYLVTYVLLKMPIFFIVYFGIKDINFKKYLEDIMWGYRIHEFYNEASIFVRMSKNAKAASFHQKMLSCSTNYEEIDYGKRDGLLTESANRMLIEQADETDDSYF